MARAGSYAPAAPPLHSSSSSSRPIAPLPNHSHLQAYGSAATSGSTAQAPSRHTSYHPKYDELRQGAKNPLFLRLRSGIDEEIDYALPRLVVASFDGSETFLLKYWVDGVASLKEWPERWLQGLEHEAALYELRAGRLDPGDAGQASDGSYKKRKVDQSIARAAMPEWKIPASTIERATNSLLVLRNASFTSSNAENICRKSFLSFLDRFFSMPIPFLLELSLRNPEPVHHLLVIVQSIFPFLQPQQEVKRIFSQVFPRLLVETRDTGMINNLLPLIISGLTIQSLPPLPADLIPHLLQLTVLRPPAPQLDYILDLLISLTLHPIHSRTILSQPNFSAHLRSLVTLLEHGATVLDFPREAPAFTQGRLCRNPASDGIRAELASRRRAQEREAAQRQMEMFGGPGVRVEVGDKPPALSQTVRDRLYATREPNRSIAWMHETFVYSSTSQLLQVTFWHAYRDFFQNPSTVEALLSASEVIKNVTIAFPGAAAKVWTDAMGAQKFVIAGMGFRKQTDDEDRFNCCWRDCPVRSSFASPAHLVAHVESSHMSTGQPVQCAWGNCSVSPFTHSHLLTHIPPTAAQPVPETVMSYPSVPEWTLGRPVITDRPLPPLPKSYKLQFSGVATPLDARRHPTGTAFLAALVVRNLARVLKNEINLASIDLEQAKEEKKKHLSEERFGLPIPENILREEEEEERATSGNANQDDDALGEAERGLAEDAFRLHEGRIMEVMEKNLSGLGQYLGEALGW
ncbi:hypothetical protein IAU60_001973 [Kwoniella sp. DSM 27419]